MTKPSRPRRDVILRRFMRGESVSAIALAYRTPDLLASEVEALIRAALNRKPRSKR